MGQVTILGSSSAVPGIGHDNTHMLVNVGGRSILVDCPGNVYVRLLEAHIDPLSITDLIITHFHPDHVAGLAPLLMNLWLIGKKTPLTIYSLEETVERAQQMMDLYGWQYWPNFYTVKYCPVSFKELAPVIEEGQLSVRASSVQHLVPTIGLRFDDGDHALVYSCDTEPSPVVIRLAQGADVLIHEATGEGIGHTSPAQAGEIARRAGVKSLYLIHYPPETRDLAQMVQQAGQAFTGEVHVAKDLMNIPF